ncbi:hypothetical protein ACIHCQ_08355 [Streptomyces sp. NPDC052236]|uniref:hypothetical protein n=1 Tax=Streptomyces sp. NPDC052236 TaxID=3365686 RepID=UPI0037D2A3EB
MAARLVQALEADVHIRVPGGERRVGPYREMGGSTPPTPRPTWERAAGFPSTGARLPALAQLAGAKAAKSVSEQRVPREILGHAPAGGSDDN